MSTNNAGSLWYSDLDRWLYNEGEGVEEITGDGCRLMAFGIIEFNFESIFWIRSFWVPPKGLFIQDGIISN